MLVITYLLSVKRACQQNVLAAYSTEHNTFVEIKIGCILFSSENMTRTLNKTPGHQTELKHFQQFLGS
jgi:hypothetical protein